VFTLATTGTYTITVDPRPVHGIADVLDGAGAGQHGHDGDRDVDDGFDDGGRGERGTDVPRYGGSELTLTLSNNTYPQVDVTVRDPNGSSVASFRIDGGHVP
jgi:hypothetical protein